MRNPKYILGIDTSNYTTSIALMRIDGEIVKDSRIPLKVKEGQAGMRQSDALFHHVNHLPQLAKDFSGLEGDIVAVAAATKPRPVENSYMPVFLAAKSYGETISSILRVPFYGFSHQEGHIEAGLWSLNKTFYKKFLAIHISGGTTEILEVTPFEDGYNIDIVGGTSDISAGQLIDRIGVKMGLPFPSGPYLEKLAIKNENETINIPISVKGSLISFSGPETFLQRKISEGFNKEIIASSVFKGIGTSLVRGIKNLPLLEEYNDLLVVGGVASNLQIKNLLLKELKDHKLTILFGKAEYCSDNAVGISALGLKKYLGG